MHKPERLTARIEQQTDPSGERIYVGLIPELPGVVIVADTREEAEEQLTAHVRSWEREHLPAAEPLNFSILSSAMTAMIDKVLPPGQVSIFEPIGMARPKAPAIEIKAGT